MDPWITIGLMVGDCFVKNCHFPAFFFGEHEFFSLIELISFIDPLQQKKQQKPDVGNLLKYY